MNFNLNADWLNVQKGSLSMSGSTSGGGGDQKQVSDSSGGGGNQKQIPSEPSGVSAEQLEGKLTEAFNAERVDIVDMSGGCGQSFEAVIVSAQFAKKTLLQRHRLVNGAIKDEVAAIHAWTPKCFTPEEFEKKVGELQQQQQQGGGRKEKSVSSKQDEGKVTTTWDNKSMSASHSTGSVTEPVDGSAGSSGVLGTVKKAVIG